MESQPEKSIFNFSADETTCNHLKGIALWAKINAIASFATIGLSLLTIFVTLAKGSDLNASYLVSRQVTYWIVSTLLNIMLISMSQHIKKAVSLNDQASLDRGMSNLSRYMKTIGILLIVFTGLVILGFFIAISLGGFGRH